MKTSVQIKAELFAGQHDALIEFYESYPRLFVNKLLLRLCEACMPLYPPKLAQFSSNKNPPAGLPKKVAIRIDAKESPVFWKFYKGLPYGAKASFIVNLMNHYAVLAEADRNLLDNLYWSGDANTPPTVEPLPSSEPAVTVGRAEGSTAKAETQSGQNELTARPAPSVAPSEPATPPVADEVVDPLSLHDTGLG